MSSEEIAINVSKLTKNYRLFGHPGDRIKQFLSLGLRQYHREFTALRDISFEVKRGEAVGIIGRNGSGKSTLLQIICSILKPSSGAVVAEGRISALLELGAGFNPEFTGRENVYFQGALQGVSKDEMDGRFSEIAAFAEIGEFIEQPVRTYSSGMFVRLAFSVAINLEPEILVVDEALAVGDFAFRAKCYRHIKSMKDAGATLIFVSHDLETIKAICSRVIYLEQGECRFDGPAGEGCNLFFNDQVGKNESDRRLKASHVSMLAPSEKLAEILDVSLEPHGATPDGKGVSYGEEATLRVRYAIHDDLDSITIAFHIRDDRQIDIVGTNSRIESCDILAPKRGDIRVCEFRFLNYLRSGEYEVCVGLAADHEGKRVYADWRDQAVLFKSSAGQRWSLISPPTRITHL